MITYLKREKYKSCKIYFTHPKTSDRTTMTYHYAPWFQNYIINPQPDWPKWKRQFCYHFRVPYHSYLDLVDQCNTSDYFKQWCGYNEYPYKKKGIPIEMLVLCVLRYLGRG